MIPKTHLTSNDITIVSCPELWNDERMSLCCKSPSWWSMCQSVLFKNTWLQVVDLYMQMTQADANQSFVIIATVSINIEKYWIRLLLTERDFQYFHRTVIDLDYTILSKNRTFYRAISLKFLNIYRVAPHL